MQLFFTLWIPFPKKSQMLLHFSKLSALFEIHRAATRRHPVKDHNTEYNLIFFFFFWCMNIEYFQTQHTVKIQVVRSVLKAYCCIITGTEKQLDRYSDFLNSQETCLLYLPTKVYKKEKKKKRQECLLGSIRPISRSSSECQIHMELTRDRKSISYNNGQHLDSIAYGNKY